MSPSLQALLQGLVSLAVLGAIGAWVDAQNRPLIDS